MTTTRLEAFSDGVIAILITIMVLELKVPEGTEWHALAPLIPLFLTYLLSFVFLGIYWNNHHHLLHVCERVNGKVLWANLHLLFWLSLIPFVTGWMGENHFAPIPTAAYGVVLLLSAIAFTILVRTMIAAAGTGSRLEAIIGSDRKGNMSLLLYVIAIPLAFVQTGISHLIFVVVAAIWIVPDSRIESALQSGNLPSHHP
jgi:uncharacterized membrane protein